MFPNRKPLIGLLLLFPLLSLTSCANVPKSVTVVKQPLPPELTALETPCTIEADPMLNRDLAEAYLLCKAKVESANAKLKAIREIID